MMPEILSAKFRSKKLLCFLLLLLTDADLERLRLGFLKRLVIVTRYRVA